MSKRTEQRLRARIRELEKLNTGLAAQLVEERIRHRNSFKISDGHITTASMVSADFPSWLRHGCLTAWAGGGAVALERVGGSRDNVNVMFMRRIYE